MFSDSASYLAKMLKAFSERIKLPISEDLRISSLASLA
jgi:hypothetical protein